MATTNERWLVVVNLAGITKPVRMKRCRSLFTNQDGWEGVKGDFSVYGKPSDKPGLREFLFKTKREADLFYRGTQAALRAVKEFAGG